LPKIPQAPPEIYAACIVAAATLLASSKEGLVGEKLPLPKRVAELALEILDEYFKKVEERRQPS
jgi:hypothetical protein